MEKILFEYNDFNDQYAIESAWADKVGNDYKLNNILFYALNYSWGDIVKVEDRNGELFVIGLVEESGHTTVRIIFFNAIDISPTVKKLEEMGCSYEGSDVSSLISVDIPPEVDYQVIRGFLNEGEQNDKWSFQEACIAHN